MAAANQRQRAGAVPRATDAAGNLTVGAWQTTTVDMVAPVITVTNYISRIEPGKYQSPLGAGLPGLTGTVTDGGLVIRLWMQVYGPHSAAYTDTVTSTGNVWSYTPLLSDGLGRYSVRVSGRWCG